MKHKSLGILILVDLVLLLTWLILMIVMGASGRMPTNAAQALDFAAEQHWLFYKVNYANAVLFAIFNGLVYAGLYALLKNDSPGWAEIGFVLVPVVVFINLFSYLSQLVVVPQLLALTAESAGGQDGSVLLPLMIQINPEGALGYFDQFGYFLMALPSLVFGFLLYKRGAPLRIGGLLLILSGVFCLPIGVGVLANIPGIVGTPSMIGGVLSIAAFALIGIKLLKVEGKVE